MKRLTIGFVLMVLMVSAVFASGEQEASPDKIELRYDQWFNRNESATMIARDIEEYKALYPNVSVKAISVSNDAYWDRLALDIASNSEGDIIQIETDGMSTYYKQRSGGAFIGLDELIDGYTLPDGTNLEEDIMGLELMKRDGKTIALPYNQLMFAHIAYRPSHFEEAGVSPNDLATWKGFLETTKKLTMDTDGDGNINRYGYGHPKDASTLARWWHLHWLWTADGGIFPKEEPPYTADRVILNSPENLYATEYLIELCKVATPPGERGALEQVSMFNSGAVSTLMIATWTLGSIAAGIEPSEAYENDFGFKAFPELHYQGEVKKPVYASWGMPVAISSNSKHPKEAFDFAAYLHSQESQKRRALTAGNIPVNRKVFDWFLEQNPNVGRFIKMGEQFELRNFPDLPEKTQVDKVFYETMQTAILGIKGPKEVLDSGAQELKKIFK